MNMMVSAAAIAAATPATHALAASPDQELIELAQQVMDRLPDHRAAIKRSSELWDAFEVRKPDRSEVLMWHAGDFVGYDIERLPDGKGRCWCNPFRISRLRGVPQYDWTLAEQNHAAFDALTKDETIFEFGAPQPHVQHLFSKVPSPHKQKRLNELIAALDEHTAACDALKAELGIPEADELADKLFDTIADLADRMKAIEPTTVLGLQAKAKMLFYWHWAGDEDESGDGCPITVEIIKGLAGAKLAA